MKLSREAQALIQEYEANNGKIGINVERCIIKLKDTKLLTPENVNAILNHPNHSNIYSALDSLHRNTDDMFTQDRFNKIVKFSIDPTSIACILHDLKAANLLNEKNENTVFNLPDDLTLTTLDHLLRELLQAHSLTQDNFVSAVDNFQKLPSLNDYGAYKDHRNELFPELATANKATPK